MNTKLIKGSIFSIVLIFAIFGSQQSLLKNQIINDKDSEISDLNSRLLSLQDSAYKYKTKLDSINSFIEEVKLEKFDFVKERFSVFNPILEDSTVNRFIEISEHFELDSTEEMFNLFVHEIILESGAKQYYQPGHPKEGQLVESYAGAIGIGQIMPNTAFSFLKRIVDSTEMSNLRCTDFSWIHESKGTYSAPEPNIRAKVREWLVNEDNNLALWGVIMRYNLNKNNNNVILALISYNAGGGGLNEFLSSGGNPNSHSYIKGIYRKEAKAEEVINA